ncbi:Co-chaperone Hsc20 [Thelephora ganbajun]|uniref:Co-chaperone Hsc20 n=1 Tax=Thelephora ganbajun TaxID=370292 RepID=A0ACB6ZRG1_THEGA|nr:Co-chaperone Hsc20 [Thelephora ganbajun]
MFDLPSAGNPFKVDDKQLARRFRKLQQTIHPDAWSAKGEAESSVAADLSSLVNHAFKTLQNPVLRAEYILREHGIDLAESEQTLEDPELLIKIMESREALDEAASQEQVDVIVSETQDAANKTMREVEEQCEKHQWEELQTSTIKLRYLQNTLNAAKAWAPS